MNEYNGVLANDTKQCSMIILLKHHGIFPETGHVLRSKEKRKLIKYRRHRLRRDMQKKFLLKEKFLVGGSFSSPPVEFTRFFRVHLRCCGIYIQILSSVMSVVYRLVFISFELLLEILVVCSTRLPTKAQLVIIYHSCQFTSTLTEIKEMKNSTNTLN